MSALAFAHLAFHWAALSVLVVAAAAPFVPRSAERADALLYVATGLLTASIAVRWLVTGHPPIFGTFENGMASSWFVCAAVIAARGGRWGVPEGLRRLFLPWAPALLAYGSFFQSEPLPLTISERSLIIDLHALLAWAAFTVLLAGSTAGIAMLVPGAGGDDSWSDFAFGTA
ncbi:MAG: hypothetical protein FDZ70_00320, partial [Actinobacteria bacterium]